MQYILNQDEYNKLNKRIPMSVEDLRDLCVLAATKIPIEHDNGDVEPYGCHLSLDECYFGLPCDDCPVGKYCPGPKNISQ